MYRILIVEDDAAIAQAMQRQISMWGLEARCARNFRNIMEEFAEFDPHLVLLDIMLPYFGGYHWCAEIRRVSKVPIVFISSASDNMNIVMAMNMGGDDFIAKPFDLNVLMAKLQAVLRRTYDFSGPAGTLEHRGAVLNLADASLTWEGERIELTRNEYRILQTLLEAGGHVVSRVFSPQPAFSRNTQTLRRMRSRKTAAEFLSSSLRAQALRRMRSRKTAAEFLSSSLRAQALRNALPLYHLRPDVTIPCTKYFCAHRNSTIIGITISTAAAIR